MFFAIYGVSLLGIASNQHFWKELIIAEVLSTVCINSAEFLVKISLVKCVVNWSLGQFETFVVQNMYF